MKKLLIGLGIVFFIIIIVFIAVGGLGFFKANNLMPSVETFISDFYAQFNMQNFSHIYNDMVDGKFKGASTYGAFEKSMKMIYEKLGAIKEQKKGKWTIFYGADGVSFNVQYSVTHEKGATTDLFTLIKHNGLWLIREYRINVNDLSNAGMI